MLQGFNQFFQEDKVQHMVSPYMTFPLYLSDQNGVELRFFFCEEEDIFRKWPSQNIQRCLPPFQPPKYKIQDSFQSLIYHEGL